MSSVNFSTLIKSRLDAIKIRKRDLEVEPELFKEVIGEEFWQILEIYNSLSMKKKAYIQQILEKLKKHEF